MTGPEENPGFFVVETCKEYHWLSLLLQRLKCVLFSFYKSFRPSTRSSSFWISSTSNENSLDVIGTWSGIVKPVEKVITGSFESYFKHVLLTLRTLRWVEMVSK